MDAAFAYLFIVAVLLAPLPFGGNTPLAWTAAGFIAGLFLLVFATRSLLAKRPFAVPFAWIAWPTVLFLGVCLWALIQSLTMTPASLHNPLWTAASQALGTQLPGAISVDPFETRVALMRLLSYGAVFWLALQLARDTKLAERMTVVLAGGFAAYALYALVNWSFALDMILWYPKTEAKGSVTATFINRNSFATFMGLGSVVFLALLAREVRHLWYRTEREERFKYRFERLVSGVAGPTGLYALGLIATLGTLFLTQSRAGFFATITALGVMSALLARRSRIGAASFGLAALLGVGLLLGTFNMSGGHLADRIAASDLAENTRSAVYARVWQVVRDYPLLGTGYGTFSDIFPLYRDETIPASGVWDKAHNTYLEVMMELGVPAALALFAAIALLAIRCLIGAVTRHRDSHLPLAAFSASTLVALHASVDFSLQIPGLTIVYAALLGIGVAQSWSSRRH